MSDIRNLTIIGSGPAGLTAALYAARANLAPVVFTGTAWGGQLMNTTEVENYPGFPEGIQGPELMQNFRKQAEKFGAELLGQDATRVDFSKAPFLVASREREVRSHAVIVASGAAVRWLGLPSETRLRGHGVSSCATCDGFFFRGKDIAVIGGGDTAVEDAIFLTKFATSVTIVHRRDHFTASKIQADRARNNPKMKFLWNREVVEFLGEGSLTGIKLKDVYSGKVEEHAFSGAFVAIGFYPATALFKGQLELDVKGYMVRGPNSTTSVTGVFVAGDVHDHRYRQAVTASAAGCQAAIDAERFLAGHDR